MSFSLFTGMTPGERIALLITTVLFLVGSVGVAVSRDYASRTLFECLHWTCSVVIGSQFAWSGVRLARNRGESAAPWWWFFLGMLSYLIGQLYWDAQVYFGGTAFPGPADFFWLLHRLTLVAGIWAYGRAFINEAESRLMLLDSAGLLAATLTLTVTLYLPHQGSFPMLQFLALVAYPAGFMAAAAIMLMLLIRIRARLDIRSLIMPMTIIANIALWIGWNRLVLNDSLQPGSLFNFLFSPFAILLGVAALLLRVEPSPDKRWAHLCDRSLNLLPLLLIMSSAIGIITVVTLPDVATAGKIVAVTGGSLVVILATIRQNLTLEGTLRERALLHAVVNTVPMRVFWKDRSGVYLGCNQLFTADAALARPEDLIGKRDDQMHWRNDAAQFQADDRAAMQSGTARLGYEDSRFMPDGRQVWRRISKVPLRDNAGQVMGVLGVYEDISERKKIDLELDEYRSSLEQLVEERTAELIQAKELAEQASHAKTQFLSSMSHELRTPLNCVLGYTQLLNLDPSLEQKIREQVNEIDAAGRLMLVLVNDLIDMARIESGGIALSMESVYVKPAAQHCLRLAAPLAVERGIVMTEEIDAGEAIAVRVDRVRLDQILMNLLANAIKYNQPEGKVTLRCHIRGEAVRFAVIDTGAGIPVEIQSRLFSAFDRLGRESGNIEGTGIGLVICKRFVEAMDGHIGFESAEDEGSTFWVEFPIEKNQ